MKGNLVIIDGVQYDEYQVDTGNQIATIREYIPTQEDIENSNKQNRISELKETILNKKLLDMDCTSEQAELKELLGL